MKDLKLRKILRKYYNLNKDESGDMIYYEWEILKAMKEACEQTVDLCAENAEGDIDTDNETYCIATGGVNKESILATKKQIV
jgi:hypothetical protein